MALVKSLLWLGGTGGIAYLVLTVLTPKDSEIRKLLPEGQAGYKPDIKQQEAFIKALKKAANVKDQDTEKPTVVEK